MEWGSTVTLRSSKRRPPMSQLGQKRTLGDVRLMSALPPIVLQNLENSH